MPTARGFTGMVGDPSGLSYDHARYYDGVVGQFTTADTVQGPNRYGYVAGNPETMTDPTGQRLIDPLNGTSFTASEYAAARSGGSSGGKKQPVCPIWGCGYGAGNCEIGTDNGANPNCATRSNAISPLEIGGNSAIIFGNVIAIIADVIIFQLKSGEAKWSALLDIILAVLSLIPTIGSLISLGGGGVYEAIYQGLMWTSGIINGLLVPVHWLLQAIKNGRWWEQAAINVAVNGLTAVTEGPLAVVQGLFLALIGPGISNLLDGAAHAAIASGIAMSLVAHNQANESISSWCKNEGSGKCVNYAPKLPDQNGDYPGTHGSIPAN
jgi:RHS repeat-associated protein